jgi:hypothetical protein
MKAVVNFAAVEATLTSMAQAMPKPAPAAAPLIAPIVGLSTSRSGSIRSVCEPMRSTRE